jgi:uncharacterized protein YdeI (YjbR/CyaY-like superfamily)
MNQEKKDNSSKVKELLEQIKDKFKNKKYKEIQFTEINELLEENTVEANRIQQIIRFIQLGSKVHVEKMEFKAFQKELRGMIEDGYLIPLD